MKKKESKTYLIIGNHCLNGHVLSTSNCIQNNKNKIYGHLY